MKIDKKMVEKAKIIEGKIKPVEWADDFLTVEAMLKEGISWKTIQKLLNEKYGKSFTLNGLVRDFKIYHTDFKGLVSSAPSESVGLAKHTEAPLMLNDLL